MSGLMQIFESSLADSLNPMNGMLRDFASMSTKAKAEEINKLQLDTIAACEEKLAAAKDRNAPDAVIAAYEKILGRYK